jgi:CheY-like chemotaxis protein
MSQAQQPSEDQEQRGGAKVILLVEDDPSNAEMLNLLLQSETPYQVLNFAYGTEVLQRLDEIKAIRPHLFLFDYHLPGMTALELHDQLHQVKEFADAPTLVVTASMLNDEQVKNELARRHIHLLQKPFEIDEFLRIVEQLMA